MTNFDTVNTRELADIRNVKVNTDLPYEERIADFVRQIKNPYFYKCGKFVVRARFAENGATFADCLCGILL
jgi:hypothetical protein